MQKKLGDLAKDELKSYINDQIRDAILDPVRDGIKDTLTDEFLEPRIKAVLAEVKGQGASA